MSGEGACRRMRRWLPLWIDDDLPASERDRLAAHREAALPEAIACGDRFWAAVRERIEIADPELARTTPLPGAPRYDWYTLGRALRIVAAAAAVLLAVFVYGPWPQRETDMRRTLRTDVPVGVPAPIDGVVPVRAQPPVPEAVAPAARPSVEYPLDGWRAPARRQDEVLSF